MGTFLVSFPRRKATCKPLPVFIVCGDRAMHVVCSAFASKRPSSFALSSFPEEGSQVFCFRKTWSHLHPFTLATIGLFPPLFYVRYVTISLRHFLLHWQIWPLNQIGELCDLVKNCELYTPRVVLASPIKKLILKKLTNVCEKSRHVFSILFYLYSW